MVRIAILSKEIWKGLTKKGAFKQRHKEYQHIWEISIPGGGDNECKGPKLTHIWFLTCLPELNGFPYSWGTTAYSNGAQSGITSPGPSAQSLNLVSFCSTLHRNKNRESGCFTCILIQQRHHGRMSFSPVSSSTKRYLSPHWNKTKTEIREELEVTPKLINWMWFPFPLQVGNE